MVSAHWAVSATYWLNTSLYTGIKDVAPPISLQVLLLLWYRSVASCLLPVVTCSLQILTFIFYLSCDRGLTDQQAWHCRSSDTAKKQPVSYACRCSPITIHNLSMCIMLIHNIIGLGPDRYMTISEHTTSVHCIDHFGTTTSVQCYIGTLHASYVAR